MLRRRRRLLFIAAIPPAVVLLFFVTADYGVQCGEHYIRRPPIASVSWGPAKRYVVQHGVNVVGDDGTRMAGNFVEFPISSDTRVSMRFFSVRWSREAFAGWASNHQRVARWLGWRSSR